MKISSRDKKLLAFLLVVAVVVVYGNFIVLPQRDSLKTLKEQESTKQIEVDTMRQIIASESRNLEQLEEKQAEALGVAYSYFTGKEQEDILVKFNGYLKKNNLVASLVEFQEIEEVDMLEDIELPEEDKDKEETINRLRMLVELEGVYEDIYNLLADLRENTEKITVEYLFMENVDETSEKLEVALLVDIYTIPILDQYVEIKDSELATGARRNVEKNIFKVSEASEEIAEEITEEQEVEEEATTEVEAVN